ncbi:putative secreted protein [Metarhizium anisopliae]|nr:putative secreted protein [Metarhizium anisopliae]
MMRSVFTVLTAIAATIAASPISHSNTTSRSLIPITDSIMFDIPLPEFTIRRDNELPNKVDWTSDGCTSSPNNPFNFPFLPACHRHDFGYANFRLQTRFTRTNKLKIDMQFRTEALANVYYSAVRVFGGHDQTPGKRMNNGLLWEYHALVDIYEEEVRKAQAAGDLPLLQ